MRYFYKDEKHRHDVLCGYTLEKLDITGNKDITYPCYISNKDMLHTLVLITYPARILHILVVPQGYVLGPFHFIC